MRLEVFLASQMRRYPDLDRQLELRAISDQELARVRIEAKAQGFLSGFSVPLDRFITSFGEPWERKENLLVYEVELWPDHLYEVGINSHGGIYHKGFRLREPQFSAMRRSHGHALATEHLRVGFHTVHEVETEFGSPSASDSWGAAEDWTYRDGSRSVVFTFDFGLLIEIINP